jgi:membrane protein implicated in regulation of membrane protease activity
VILVGAILLALYVVDGPWEIVVVAAAVCIELGQTAFWFWWTKRRRPQVGAEALAGALAQVVEDCTPNGLVRVQGELWQAHCAAGARTGERVRVRSLTGLVLDVEPLSSS